MARFKRKIRFWITGHPGLSEGELVIRFRRWWHRHWWPSRIRQLDRERRYWRSLVTEGVLDESHESDSMPDDHSGCDWFQGGDS